MVTVFVCALIGAGVGYLVVGNATGVEALADHVASPGVLGVMAAMPGILVGAGIGGLSGALLYRLFARSQAAEHVAAEVVRPSAGASSTLVMTCLAMGFVGIVLSVGALYLSSLRLVDVSAVTSAPPYIEAGIAGALAGVFVLGPLIHLRARERAQRTAAKDRNADA